MEVRGQIAAGSIKTEVGSQRSEGRRQRSEVRDQRSEVRRQRTEGRRQKSEVRDQTSEVREGLLENWKTRELVKQMNCLSLTARSVLSLSKGLPPALSLSNGFTISSWVSASWAIAQAQFSPGFEIVFYWQLSFH